MKKSGMLSVVMAGIFLGGCGDDDKEFQLDTNQMTGIDWYYNGGLENNRFSYSDAKVLKINRFDRNGEIRGVDARGKADTLAGTWKEKGLNTLFVEWKDGNTDTWTVHDCNSRELVVSNDWGERRYVAEPDYARDLTGDAFWMNYFDGDASKTRLGFQISSGNNLRPGYVYALLSDDKSGQIELDKKNHVWKGETDPGRVESRKVRFSCRVGSRDYVKFDEWITGKNFAPMRLSEVGMKISKTAGSNQLEITWHKFEGENVCYRVEVYSKGNDEDIYFESDLFPYVNNYLLSESTMGKINRLKDIDTRKEYEIRLTAVMLEPGVAYNTTIAANRVQAVVHVVDKFNW